METLKILVVDNEPALARAYGRLLHGRAEVLSVDDTDKAYDLFVENPDIHAVIMDSDTSGHQFKTTYALALAIRSCRPKCVLVAATGSPGSCVRLWDFCDQRLAKPFDVEEFWKALGLASST